MTMTKVMLKGGKVFWLAWMFLVVSAARGTEASSFFSDLTFEAALKQAGEQQKIVLIDFFTTWCGPCKMLDQTTWTDAKVAALLVEKTVALKIDAEKEAALAKKYKINAYPTVLLLKADGTIIDRLIGYRAPDVFIADFNSALSGKSSLERARETADADGGLDPMKREDFGDALAQSGKKDEALTEYLWCFDEGLKHAPAYVGVRSSYLLSAIARLAKNYPPALEALKTRRDAAKQSLANNPRDRTAAGDFSSLNHALEDDAATLAYFDELPAGSPVRTAIGYHVFGLLLEAKRYADAAEAMPYKRYIGRFDHVVKQFSGPGVTKLRPGAMESMRKFQCENAAEELEALAGSGSLDESRELIKKILDFDHSDETVATLRKHLERAGRIDLLPTTEPPAPKSDSQEKS